VTQHDCDWVPKQAGSVNSPIKELSIKIGGPDCDWRRSCARVARVAYALIGTQVKPGT